MSTTTGGEARGLRRLGALALAVAVAMSIQACSSVPRRLAPPQANLLSLSVLEARPDGQLFELRLELVNPNSAEIPVVRMDFDLRLSGEGRLIGEYTVPFTLPGLGSHTLSVEIFSAIVSSVSRLMAFTQGPNNELGYDFHGELVLNAALRDPIVVSQRGQVPLIIAIEDR
ncbi:MAG: LEA type 2 family protein [Gammaproteobacteria bacterium]|nr:LEA type 2 family protein [Gammaproteobacteria bacterium]